MECGTRLTLKWAYHTYIELDRNPLALPLWALFNHSPFPNGQVLPGGTIPVEGAQAH